MTVLIYLRPSYLFVFDGLMGEKINMPRHPGWREPAPPSFHVKPKVNMHLEPPNFAYTARNPSALHFYFLRTEVKSLALPARIRFNT